MNSKVLKIKIGKKKVYYKEIVHEIDFERLYLREKPICSFISKVTTKTKRPFITFHAESRKELKFKENEIIVLRTCKGNREFQSISKIYKWGKIHISKEVVKSLSLKNQEKVKFHIISRNNEFVKEKKKDFLDLYELSGKEVKIIPRKNGFITIYKKQKIPITLPRLIKINQELLETFFLIHGDGHYKSKLYFVSKTPELIRFVMKVFVEQFRFSKEKWRSKINMSDLDHAEEARKYWKKQLNLKNKQFYVTAKSKFNTEKYGNLRIIIDKTIVALIFRFIFNKLKSKLEDINSLHALNGLLCAEGGAQMGKRGLHRITLSFNQEEKALFEEVLLKTNILRLCKVSQEKTFVIEKWDNLYSFFKGLILKSIIPFKYHPERKKNALEGFLAHSFTKTMKTYLSEISKERLTTSKLARKLGIRRDSVLNTLRKRRYGKFVNLKRSKNSFMISMKDEGAIFLDLIEKMEELKEKHMEDKLPFEKTKREVLVKKEATSNPDFGGFPAERSVEENIKFGIINLNKPAGPTSHLTADYVKKIFGSTKAGHSGTLVD